MGETMINHVQTCLEKAQYVLASICRNKLFKGTDWHIGCGFDRLNTCEPRCPTVLFLIQNLPVLYRDTQYVVFQIKIRRVQ